MTITYNFNNDNNTATVASSDDINIVIPLTIFDNGTEYTIIALADDCFKETDIISCSIEANVKTIGNRVFFGCTQLTTVTIKSNLTIGTDVFTGCTSLTAINFSTGIVPIGANWQGVIDKLLYSFIVDTLKYNITDFTNNNVQLIQNNYIDAITVPANFTTNGVQYTVTAVADNCFIGRGITSCTLPDSITIIVTNFFKNCSSLTTMSFSTTVTTLGNTVFSGCTNLTTVNINSNLTIGTGVFTNCTSLTAINFNGVVPIGENWQGVTIILNYSLIKDGLKYNITNFTNNNVQLIANEYTDVIIVPANFIFNTVLYTVATLANDCFKGRSITSCTLPASITTLVTEFFSNCTQLTTITLQVTTIGTGVFTGCTSLTAINFIGVVPIGQNWQDFINILNYNLIDNALKYNITNFTNNNVQLIANGYTGAITIPANFTNNSVNYIVTTLVNSCFEGTNITICNIGSNVTTIGNRVFFGCTQLTTVSIRSNLTIGTDVFTGCTSLTAINFSNVVPIGANWQGVIDKLSYIFVVDTLKYNITDFTNNNVQLIQNNYIDAITVPANFTTNDVKYTVTAVADNCFIGRGITSCTLPDSITTIVTDFFKNCTSLTTMSFSTTVTTLGNTVFSGCTNLTDVNINSNLTIGTGIFTNCTSLTDINFNGVVPIGINWQGVINKLRYSFIVDTLKYNITNFTTSTINNVQLIANAYTGQIIVPANFTSNGVGVQYIVTAVASDCFKERSITSCTLPDSITTLVTDFFNGCTSLTSIILQETVTTIGDTVFSGCTSLTTVNINSNLTIGTGVFTGCTSLTAINFSTGIVPIGANWQNVINILNYSFINNGLKYKITAFTTSTTNNVQLIPHEYVGVITVLANFISNDVNYIVTVIADDCFKDKAITSCTLPNSIITIGNNVFSGCTQLTTVNINSILIIGTGVFTGCTSLTAINFNGVIPIGENWQNVINILNYNFVNNNFKYKITNFTNNNVQLIANTYTGAIIILTNFTVNTVQYTVTAIGSNCFDGTAITSCILPNSITTISTNAFSNCAVNTITVQSEITSIAENAFDGTFIQPGTMQFINFTPSQLWTNLNLNVTFLFSFTLNNITYKLTDNTNVQIIKSEFNGSLTLTSPFVYNTIEYTITSIGNTSFANSALTNLILPSSLQNIQNNVFDNCTGLVTIQFNSYVTIGTNIFNGCTSLTTVNFINSIPIGIFWDTVLITLSYNFINNLNEYTITNFTIREVSVKLAVNEIPSTFVNNGLTYIVTSFSGSSYTGNTVIETITIPNSVTTIENDAFKGCTNLTIIDFANVTNIGNNAFENCTSLITINLPNLLLISASMFKGCTSLETIIIPNTVIEIRSNVFENCTSLTTLNLVNVTNIGDSLFKNTGLTTINLQNITTMGTGIFENCTSLTNCILPNLLSIPINMFKSCTSLDTITIPNTTTSIGTSAFESSALTTISLPTSLLTIGNNAFKTCTSLDTITIPNTTTNIGMSAFESSALTTISLPTSLLTIDNNAFKTCTNLTDVTIKSTINIGTSIFDNCTNLTNIYFIPNDKFTNDWKTYFYGLAATTAP